MRKNIIGVAIVGIGALLLTSCNEVSETVAKQRLEEINNVVTDEEYELPSEYSLSGKIEESANIKSGGTTTTSSAKSELTIKVSAKNHYLYLLTNTSSGEEELEKVEQWAYLEDDTIYLVHESSDENGTTKFHQEINFSDSEFKALQNDLNEQCIEGLFDLITELFTNWDEAINAEGQSVIYQSTGAGNLAIIFEVKNLEATVSGIEGTVNGVSEIKIDNYLPISYKEEATVTFKGNVTGTFTSKIGFEIKYSTPSISKPNLDDYPLYEDMLTC